LTRFFSSKYKNLTPYTPGEQPAGIERFIKLNTNESPFPPSPKAVEMASEAAKSLQLYPDPECTLLHTKLAQTLGVEKDEVLCTNGSDEILNFAFMAFCDENTPAVFADITYGFYKVFAQINNLPYKTLPLKEDFSIDVNDYLGAKGTIFIANPNAPTGLALSLSDIEKILKANPDNVVVIDEAYVDFGTESAVKLIHKYNNLLVTQTFSKSRSMAGARLGFGVACKELIRDLNTIKYSTNPYNINRLTMSAGYGVLCDEEYTKKNCRTIIENRTFTENELKKLGFEFSPSMTNFVFVKHPLIDGEKLYLSLKERDILVRHFKDARICEYNRITIGTREQMEKLICAVKDILEENK